MDAPSPVEPILLNNRVEAQPLGAMGQRANLAKILQDMKNIQQALQSTKRTVS